jgi:hypothetical protein
MVELVRKVGGSGSRDVATLPGEVINRQNLTCPD